MTNANPLGTRGFAFIEYASPNPAELDKLFHRFGFRLKGKHKSKNARLYGQGRIRLIVTEEAGSHASQFAEKHGPSVPAMGWLMADAQKAYQGAIERGARAYEGHNKTLNAPAILGIG